MGYKIIDWNSYFECSKSRERDRCSWVPTPNKIGMGLTRILSLPNGAAIFGIWILIVQACSRQRRVRDGHLTDTGRADGRSWTINDMAMMWRRPEAEIKEAIDTLCSKSIGWMELVGEVPAKCPPSARQVPAKCPGMEGNGREGREGKSDICTEPVKPSPCRPTKQLKPGDPKLVKWADGFTGIDQTHIERWSETYPACDINAELLKATEWIYANPTKMKKNWYSFIVRWLSRCQERGGTKSFTTPDEGQYDAPSQEEIDRVERMAAKAFAELKADSA